MFISILTLISALSISAVAIYYSVAGLAAIFAAAVVPIIIMGVVLELGKLVTAVWLHRYWNTAVWWLKTYLVVALIVLMFITSMGIFGFLSKAHVEQTALNQDQQAKIVQIESTIERSEAKIDRWNNDLDRLLKGEDVRVDSLVLREQTELDKIFTKIKQEKDDARLDADKEVALQQDRITQAKERKDADIKTAQERYKGAFSKRKLDDAINQAKANELSVAAKAQKEILEIKQRLDEKFNTIESKYAGQITDLETRIADLRSQANNKTEDIEGRIVALENQIDAESKTVDKAREEKADYETEYRKLEAEVGPVKYIAEFVYGEKATQDLLEAAVRWVIIVIIFVFDPLAVLLLIAANMSLVKRLPKTEPDLVNLEKPDPEDFNEVAKADTELSNKKAELEKIEKEMQDKLAKFNEKVPQPEDKPVEIVQEDLAFEGHPIPHIDLSSQKKTEDKEIVADNTKDGYNPDEHIYDLPEEPKVDKEKQLEEFKKREAEEQKALEEFARKAREDEEEQSISEQIEEVMEPERLKPDFTEVVEPDPVIETPKIKKQKMGILGQRVVQKGKTVETIEPEIKKTDSEVKQMLDQFHNEHGKFEDVSEDELKQERDEANRLQFLEDVGLTEDEARNHPPITESRKAFFQDHIDDIKRGDTTIENLPPELAKTIAVLMSDYDDPTVITKSEAIQKSNIESTTAEGLKEKFMIDPKTEDRDMTDDELDQLLDGWEEKQKPDPTIPMKMVIKDGKRRMVPDTSYKQNEEQSDETMWNKVKELDIPEPEKNELELPTLENTEEPPVSADEIKMEATIPTQKFTNHKNRLGSDEDYRQRIENRINDQITKLENGELSLNDLTKEDRDTIMEILNQNG